MQRVRCSPPLPPRCRSEIAARRSERGRAGTTIPRERRAAYPSEIRNRVRAGLHKRELRSGTARPHRRTRPRMCRRRVGHVRRRHGVSAQRVGRLVRRARTDPRAALVGALYYSRDSFRPMVVDRWDESDTRTAVIPAFDHEPIPVDGVGFGCVALRVSALRDLMPPYFPAHVFVERGAGRVRVCNEDYLFCARLRRAGHRVLLHAGVRCGHYDRQTNTVAPQDVGTVRAYATRANGRNGRRPPGARRRATRGIKHHRIARARKRGLRRYTVKTSWAPTERR